MHLLSAALYAVTANLDCLTIAIAYGIKKTKIPLPYTIWIALVSSIGTYLSMKVGHLISSYIPITIANHLGSIILAAIGVGMIINDRMTKRNSLKEEQEISYHTITFKEVFLLSIALTLNNMALGISASITGIPINWTTIFTFIISVLFMQIGQRLGSSFLSNFFGRYANAITGVLLFILGMYELYI